jgi:hypothetical protein
MIYVKTAIGQAAMQDRSAGLSPRQRSAFIMFDGKRDSSDVLKMTAGVGVAQFDIDHLLSLGLLQGCSPATAVQPPASQSLVSAVHSDAFVSSVKDNKTPTMSAQAHYSMAYPIATRLTAALGLRGFMLNLAVEAAGDLDKLKELAPKIKDAVGDEKYKALDEALNF